MSKDNIEVPELGESITEGTIASWFKNEGDAVEADEPVVELETDKVTVEINSPSEGILEKILKNIGETVKVHEVIGVVSAGKNIGPAAEEEKKSAKETSKETAAKDIESLTTPSARLLIEENSLDIAAIKGSGKHGQITKEDVLLYLEGASKAEEKQSPGPKKETQIKGPAILQDTKGLEEIKPMSRLRQAIANRLVEAQHTAAILTTFNEIDMKAVIDLRARYKESFEKKHGVKLGFMSFFAKAAVNALKEIPAINAEIRGENIVYKNYYNLGVAVGGPKGLVVPVVRDVDKMTFAEIEKELGRLAEKVKTGSIALSDLEGGTFSITNGGIYGSMMSTPILNPPQSGILGMHNIVKRAVVVGDEIQIRPMMYAALSYDHRIVDGKEAVTFLVKIKEAIEDPSRLMLEV
ncbi:MAG: 2-oxoglutarate dehydrogenase complex dihydrolipoyllysine-residue succinyltransferase [Spirochaetia bacterium]|nr:2-oxoglutarate dehydrogenase complex dihydrolipoyllysine-residue succinyltransferase [Spirochaetia bacterium]